MRSEDYYWHPTLLGFLILVEIHAIATRFFVFYHLEIFGAEAKGFQYTITELPDRLAAKDFRLNMPPETRKKRIALTSFSFPHISLISFSCAALTLGGRVRN